MATWVCRHLLAAGTSGRGSTASPEVNNDEKQKGENYKVVPNLDFQIVDERWLVPFRVLYHFVERELPGVPRNQSIAWRPLLHRYGCDDAFTKYEDIELLHSAKILQDLAHGVRGDLDSACV